MLSLVAGRAHAQETGIAVGSQAPAVVVQALDGPPVDLGTLIGRKPFLLEFWATWCEVCEALLPTVRQAHKRSAARWNSSASTWRSTRRPSGCGNILRPTSRRSARCTTRSASARRAYGAPTTSFIVIVDRSGKVSYTGTGENQDLATALRTVAAK